MLFFKRIQSLWHECCFKIHIVIDIHIVSHFKRIILRVSRRFKLRNKIAQINFRTNALRPTPS